MKHPNHVATTLADRLHRAQMHLNSGVYHLGHGGRDPSAPDPFDHDDPDHGGAPTADCSGYVNWLCGWDRFAPGNLPNLSAHDDTDGVWFSCENIVRDARNPQHFRYRLVRGGEEVLPGDVVVYPPHPGKAYGHVGMIVQVLAGFADARRQGHGWGRQLVVSHCSTGNGGIAVRLNDAGIWERDGYAYFVRPVAPDGTDAP